MLQFSKTVACDTGARTVARQALLENASLNLYNLFCRRYIFLPEDSAETFVLHRQPDHSLRGNLLLVNSGEIQQHKQRQKQKDIQMQKKFQRQIQIQKTQIHIQIQTFNAMQI